LAGYYTIDTHESEFSEATGTSLLVYLIKPLVENPAARPLQPFAKAGRILTDRARSNFRFTKFNRVANQPGSMRCGSGST
jgi:hypothetical protein